MRVRVAILGTGLIGCSIGLRLRRDAGARPVEVVGYDRYPEVARLALKAGAVERVAHTPAHAVEGADLVVLAAPVLAIRQLLEEIAPAVGANAVITDTGSTKAEVMRWAGEFLPLHTGFVGGHPMAGKTESGPMAASAELFQGARWVVVPTVRSSEQAIGVVLKLIATLGAEPLYMDASEHDAYVAAISHMPMLAATALFSMERASEAWPELSQLAAGGFRDMTRLSGTDAAMAFDILVTNREHTLHWLDRYIVALRELRDRVADAGGDPALFRLIASTGFEYSAFLNGRVGRAAQSEVPELTRSAVDDIITGGWMGEKLAEVTRASEERVRRLDEERRSRRDV